MSAIGPGIGPVNLASSLTGAQSAQGLADQTKAESAERAFQVTRDRLTAQTMGDVSEAGFSPERDADGRQAYSEQAPAEEQQSTDEAAETATAAQRHRVADAFGERGTTLDLEA